MQIQTAQLKKYTPLLNLILFAIAAYLVNKQIAHYGWQNLWSEIFKRPKETLDKMFFICFFGYATLGLCEWVAVNYTGEKLSFRKIMFGAFLSNAISHNVGSSLVSGGTIRYRYYSEWGLSKSAIAKITAFGSISYFLSAFTLLLITACTAPNHFSLDLDSKNYSLKILLIIGGSVILGWLFLSAFHRKNMYLGKLKLSPPSPKIVLQQISLGTIDLTIAAIVLYIPLLNFSALNFSEFLIYYLVAQLIGLASQVPGGVGIFETSFMLLAGTKLPPQQLLSALIMYRLVYYIAPLILAGAAAVLYETRGHLLIEKFKINYIFRFIYFATPKIFSALLLMGGAILLVSGATPPAPGRLEWLNDYIPLTLIEFSHLVNSLVGLGMIFLSRAVNIKLDSAYYGTVILLCVGIIVSLAKGWDFEEAIILGFMLIAFIPTRKHFYRKSALIQLDIPFVQLLIGSAIVGMTTLLGFYSYKSVAYTHDLWWHVSIAGDAPRFLRSLFGISVVVAAFLLYRVISKTKPNLDLPTREELLVTIDLVHNSTTTEHHLVLTGDKYILWSKSKKSFLMFGITQKFWIAMGDPVGDAAEFEALVWEFRERADKVAAKIAFYEIGVAHIPLYLDVGLSLIKLGQQALIPLQNFGIEGKKRQNFRNAINKYQRDGFTFDIVLAKDVNALLPQLKLISDQWLKAKKTKEKRFSLGSFNKEYLQNCNIAVVKKDEKIYAFCNLWMLNSRREISFDLMRYLKETPNGIMEFLNISLILWAKEQGFNHFNLGMAPLSGLENHELAPLWHKIGNTIFKKGGDFYNFSGVYFYKEKYNPEWQPIYLAAPPGLQTAGALLAATTLISGGMRGIFSK